MVLNRDLLVITNKLKWRYVDDLPEFKAQRNMNFLGGCPTIKLTEIISDMKWIHYAYPGRFMNVNPKTKGGSPRKFHKGQKSGFITTLPIRKKIPSAPTGGSLTNFVLISEKKS